jgi:hypothetical protein
VIDLPTLARAFERVHLATAKEWATIAAEASDERRAWIDQVASQLGRRRHVAAVRRRLAAGDGSASMIGRRALLSPEAHDEELAALAERPARREKTESTGERIARRLSLVGGASR